MSAYCNKNAELKANRDSLFGKRHLQPVAAALALVLAASILEHSHILERHQAFLHHLFDSWKQSSDLLRAVDNFDDDRQVFGHRGRQFLGGHLEAPVAVDADDGRVRACGLRADRSV